MGKSRKVGANTFLSLLATKESLCIFLGSGDCWLCRQLEAVALSERNLSSSVEVSNIMIHCSWES